jgi:uncharacterized membrane protein
MEWCATLDLFNCGIHSIHIEKSVIQKRIDRVLRTIFFFLYFGIFVISIYAPVIQSLQGYPAGENIYTMFSPICHQYPTRCFWIMERPSALCARCTSAYLGIAIASLMSWPRSSFKSRAFTGFFLICIAAADPVLQLLGFYESNNCLRLITGLIGGFGAFMLFYPLPFTYKGQES